MKKVSYQWYLVAVRRGQGEKVVAEIKKWENYPTYIRDLKIVPEWEGYLLCRCSSVSEVEAFFYRLNQSTGLRVGRFLPEPISPFMIENLLAKIAAKKKTKEPKSTETSSEFKVGDLVKIKTGMFVNQEGRITHLNKRRQKVKIRVENSGTEITNIPLTNCQKVFD
ncbi:MAG: hypothetical protein I3273_00555 [Candidatus Moeniiplasma glomeromycotorum]|nr:hypothetical protein [Candidatus Moeniiplasma glomeromycotorum]MCE8167384.1 hypothetical protein [Candidatus Moeniiplasma glomeromycotorum]MCE8168603.1 hypothetical protein [Candidatus Moeniiplasma glomeromycotorum]